MGEELVSLELIDANPWQPRTYVDPVKVAELAESIREHGLLQAPAGRRLPDGRVQLAFGHRRLAAYRLLQAVAPDTRYSQMPVDIVAWTDRQMAEHAAIETSQHEDFTAIDMASGMQRLIDAFGLTQIEAGKLFGLQTQGAVSNKLSLLKLPVEMQELIQAGTLPERLARALRSLAQVDAKAAVKIAATIAGADSDVRDGVFVCALDDYVRRRGESLNGPPWKSLDWPPEPIASGNAYVPEIPKCSGCPFNVRVSLANDRLRGCIRKQCFGLKVHVWAQAEAERVGKKMGIAVIGSDEKASSVFGGD